MLFLKKLFSNTHNYDFFCNINNQIFLKIFIELLLNIKEKDNNNINIFTILCKIILLIKSAIYSFVLLDC